MSPMLALLCVSQKMFTHLTGGESFAAVETGLELEEDRSQVPVIGDLQAGLVSLRCWT